MNPVDSKTLHGTQTGLFGGLGSFWYTQTTPEHARQLRGLARSSFMHPLSQDILGTGRLTSGARAFGDYLSLRVDPGTLAVIRGDAGPQLESLAGNPEGWLGIYTLPPDPHSDYLALFEENVEHTLLTEYNQILLWPNPDTEYQAKVRARDLIDTWVLPVDDNLLVTRVQRDDGRWMVRDLEFRSEPGVVLFYEDPSLWCPSQRACVCGVHPRRNVMEYTQRLDGVPSPAQWVSRWMRGSQSLSVFHRALAEASGLQVAGVDGTVLGILNMPVGAVYYTQYEVLPCMYPHTPLTEGQRLEAGEVIGNLEVQFADNLLGITLDANLFSGVFLRRARQFIYREKPLGIPLEIIMELDT